MSIWSRTLHCYSLTTIQWLIQRLLHIQPRRVRIPYTQYTTIRDNSPRERQSKTVLDSGFLREQGWRSDESSRLPPKWPGFESWPRRHMWVEFVVGSLPCSEIFFSRYSGFSPLLLKNQHFQIPVWSGTHGHVSASSHELLSAPWLDKLQFYSLDFGFFVIRIWIPDSNL